MVEATFIDQTVSILEWNEKISAGGSGGARQVILVPLTGPCVQQFTSQTTPFTATQDGRAVGTSGYPTEPPPAFPGAELPTERRIIEETPERWGAPGKAQYTRWPKSWHYSFASVGPLITHPALWPS